MFDESPLCDVNPLGCQLSVSVSIDYLTWPELHEILVLVAILHFQVSNSHKCLFSLLDAKWNSKINAVSHQCLYDKSWSADSFVCSIWQWVVYCHKELRFHVIIFGYKTKDLSNKKVVMPVETYTVTNPSTQKPHKLSNQLHKGWK